LADQEAKPGFAIFAPAHEAAAIRAALTEAGHRAVRVSPAELAEQLAAGEIALLAASAATLRELGGDALDALPPALLLIDRGEDLGWLPGASARAWLLERPLEPSLVAAAAASAVEFQRREQALMRELRAAQEAYQALGATLEERAAERSRQLESAYDRLVREAEERWAAEERLRESEELYRYTVELSQQMAWTADPDGTILTVSGRFGELTGLASDTSPHEGWLRSMHRDDADRVLAHWRAAIADGRPTSVDFRMRLADGSFRTFRARAAPRFDEAGKVMRWYGTTEDIEAQTQADAERRLAEERYRLAAHATNDAVWDLDLVSGRIEWTASPTGFFGYRDTSELNSMSWWKDSIHPEERESVAAGFTAVVDGSGTHWSDSYRFRRADGGYAHVYDQGYVVRDSRGNGLRAVGAMADVTDRQRAEAELRRMQSELIHVSRLSAMGAMASTLAHEINQPLTAVSNYVSGCRRLLDGVSGQSVAAIAEALEAGEAAAQRAGNIVRRLRELVARGNVSVRAEDLTRLIRDACEIALVDARLQGISWRVRAGQGVHWVYADRVQIQQVLINLIRNAVQALADQPTRMLIIGARARPDENKVEISVADTGPGFADGVEEALFAPFRSTKAEGMGIGLSISRTIVEAHGGKIWAERRKRGGTIFRFTLPAAEEQAAGQDPLALLLPPLSR
jgi:two-component system sensor kinase FixL